MSFVHWIISMETHRRRSGGVVVTADDTKVDSRPAPLLSVLRQDSSLLVAQCFGGHFKP